MNSDAENLSHWLLVEEGRCPNWYAAMREFMWTVSNIRSKFGVPRAVAQHIQGCFPTFSEARSIVNAHMELTSQVGH